MNVALILAGGTGSRMGSDCPKQLMLLENKPVICHSIEAFQSHKDIDSIVVVCNKDDEHSYDFLFDKQYNFTKLLPLVLGGETRKQSSLRGLLSIKDRFADDTVVLIHDAARPLVTQQIISNNITTCRQYGACTTAISASDTLLISHDGVAFDKVADRSIHYLAQTPQSFNLELILKAHSLCTDETTDDTSLLLRSNIPVQIVNGSKQNIKLTTAGDFIIAKGFLKN